VGCGGRRWGGRAAARATGREVQEAVERRALRRLDGHTRHGLALGGQRAQLEVVVHGNVRRQHVQVLYGLLEQQHSND